MLNKRLIIYVSVTLFCGIFSYVYEHFSHGVVSTYMVWLFTVPLVLGVLPELIGRLAPRLRSRSEWAKIFQNFAVATLATGSTLQGVIEIYGTTSPHTIYYLGAGVILLVLAIVFWAKGLGQKDDTDSGPAHS